MTMWSTATGNILCSKVKKFGNDLNLSRQETQITDRKAIKEERLDYLRNF